jgi:hypothetical protein
MNLLKAFIYLLVVTTLAGASNAKDKFHGEISDTQCAMNVHSLSRSHEEMIAMKTRGTDSASCAKACVKRGGEWVLRSEDDIYRLKNQSGIEDFAGHKVLVTGVLDTKTNTIDNLHIEDTPALKKTTNH